MTPEAQRIAIAKACGFVSEPDEYYLDRIAWRHSTNKAWGRGCTFDLPNYLNDLNAIREAVLKLFPNQVPMGFYHPQWNALMDNLKVATGHEPHHWNEYALMTASAAEWAQAIVKTIGKWQEDAC